MKSMIIPDVHTKSVLAEEIIKKENPDEVVFLGDYFDSWDDGVDITLQTAEWLKESMGKSNRIHLLGNHDNSYREPEKYTCSGFELPKKHAIDKVGVDLNKLKHYVWVDDWLCTHAGLSYDFFKEYAKNEEDVNMFLKRFSEDKKLKPTLYSVSYYRGGYDKYGGIIWCDQREFKEIPGVKQIFGHTVGDLVRYGKSYYCIDTAMNNYAVYDHGKSKMMIKDVDNKLLFDFEHGILN